MNLRSSPVHGCLDNRISVMAGFEFPELVLLLLIFSILSLLFAEWDYASLISFIPTIILGLIIRIARRGRSEGYLIAWVRFQFRPGTLSAFKVSRYPKQPPSLGGS